MMDTVKSARPLHLTDNEDKLVRAVARLYIRVQSERDRANLSDQMKHYLGGPLSFVDNYPEWLSEQDWIGTPTDQVLSVDSRSFNQFRRQVSANDFYGHDPITVKTR